MHRMSLYCLVPLLWLGAGLPLALAGGQGYPNGGGRPGMGQPGMSGPPSEISTTPTVDKPDKAASKAYAAAVKSLKRAHEYEDALAKATNPDKKAEFVDKIGDAYGKALDQFTEALSNKGDMVEAWNGRATCICASARTTSRSTITTIR